MFKKILKFMDHISFVKSDKKIPIKNNPSENFASNSEGSFLAIAPRYVRTAIAPPPFVVSRYLIAESLLSLERL